MAVHQQPGEVPRPRPTRHDQEQTSQLIDWFAEGQTVSVEFAGVVMTVRYVCRKGRRARIAITGPARTVYRALDLS